MSNLKITQCCQSDIIYPLVWRCSECHGQINPITRQRCFCKEKKGEGIYIDVAYCKKCGQIVEWDSEREEYVTFGDDIIAIYKEKSK